uniref:Uncharacterized protein n=1 Tax=Anguilla anguilla TaxID=7936 RepID=A0A0E9UKW5_ANGAN
MDRLKQSLPFTVIQAEHCIT